MRHRWLAVGGLIVALSVPGAGVAPAQSYDFSAATQWLEQNLDAYQGEVLVQLFQGEREIFRFQRGAITHDSQLRMGSASKWLSSAIVLRLVEAGELGLDDRIGDHLPVFDLFGKGDVTLRRRDEGGMTARLVLPPADAGSPD